MSDYFRVKNHNYYGDIIALSEKVVCLYLSKQDLDEKIPAYDLD